ncbi:MAG: DUF3238 domain-containing protein [Pseudomonadota bacterium]
MASSFLALASSPSTLTAQGSIVPFALRIYIPAPAVRFFGRAFNGGNKVQISGSIDMSQTGGAAIEVRSRNFGQTLEYDLSSLNDVDGKPDWWKQPKGSPLTIGSGTQVPTNENLSAEWKTWGQASHGFLLKVSGENPLPAFAPAIDAQIHVGLRFAEDGLHYKLDAMHDGFPNFELHVGSRCVLDYDCVASGEGPLALGPGMDKRKTTDWTKL